MDIGSEHNHRLARIDPLPAPAPRLDANDAGYRRVEAAGGAVEAVATSVRRDEASPDAVWGALHEHRLDVRVAGDEPGAAFGALLDDWLHAVAGVERRGDRESAATLSVASRDVDLVAPLLERGFAPVGVSAVRLRPRGTTDAAQRAAMPATIDGARVRLARVADADTLGVLDARLLALDARFGGVSVRPGAAARFADDYRARLAAAPDTTWVLERDGAVTGFLHAVPHEVAAEPGTPLLSLRGGHYLFVMYLAETERGHGTGAQLAGAAHRMLDAAGSAYTLLNYAASNPRSGPFWARSGYRPLTTDWQRRPAVPAV